MLDEPFKAWEEEREEFWEELCETKIEKSGILLLFCVVILSSSFGSVRCDGNGCSGCCCCCGFI
jgi:hypothetical protein